MTSPWRPRPDRGSPPHERASELLVERLDGPLERDDAAWLDTHLNGCHACRALGEAFESDRTELRSLRRQPIEPPRDLWARTAAALDREAVSGRSRRSQRRRAAPAPMGAAAGLLVVAVVIGATVLSGRNTVTPNPSATQASPTPPLTAVSRPPSVAPTATQIASAEPTPLSVPSGDVPYLAADDDGNPVLLNLGVSEVCSTNGADCAPIEPSSPRVLELPNSPRAVIQSPDEEQLIVVDEGAKGDGGTITLVPVPGPAAPSEPPTTEPPVTSSPPTPTPPVAQSSTPTPTPTPTPATTQGPAATPTTPVTASPIASDPTTASPTESVPTSTSPTATIAPTEPATPTPTATATATAIAENVIVDGSTAAFSPDGRFLAFSARPSDASQGPDIYLWATDGAEPAVPITTDHRSVFAGWLGDTILGSRVVDQPAEGSASPDPDIRRRGESFLVDPETGEITTIPDQPLWRPSVDPAGSRAVYWEGTLVLDETGDPRTDIGRLVLGPWTAALTGAGSPDASAGPSSNSDPEKTPPLPSVGGSSASPDAALDVLAEGPLVDWDAQWDETGTHLAVWIADPDDPTTGKLSLYTVDPESGRLDTDLTALRDERALPGFAIGQGKLVWATPPGQNAEASHVRVLAWTADGVGQVESHPAEDIVVIR